MGFFGIRCIRKRDPGRDIPGLVSNGVQGKRHWKDLIKDAVEQANKLLIGESKTNMFVTLFYAIIDPKNMSLRYTNAGHNPALLIREGTGDAILLKSQGCPLGLVEDSRVGVGDIVMNKGDVVVIYTDGMTEAVNERNEQFEAERLSRVVMQNRALSAQAIIGKAQEELSSFVGNQPQFDDITLMIIKAVTTTTGGVK